MFAFWPLRQTKVSDTKLTGHTLASKNYLLQIIHGKLTYAMRTNACDMLTIGSDAALMLRTSKYTYIPENFPEPQQCRDAKTSAHTPRARVAGADRDRWRRVVNYVARSR